MLRRLPPLNALKAFEASARHQSFTLASAELCVTQGAISQQVKALEARLGLKLFNRTRKGLTITQAGCDYLDVVRDAFDRIAAGTARITQQYKSNVLTVSTSPDFAAKWLVHRLGDFAKQYPEIELRLSASLHHVDFATEDVDMAVRHGDGQWAGLSSVRLSSEQLLPVCSPVVANKALQGKALQVLTPEAVLSIPLLHVNDYANWRRWFDLVRQPISSPLQGLIVNRDSMVIDAAINGQGFALARSSLVLKDLLAGHLVAPFKQTLPLPTAYWIVAPQASADLSKVSVFRTWLLDNAQADRQDMAMAGLSS
jgi:LysR family transcriptional regulator, glycine cleavage system transcriptional activator